MVAVKGSWLESESMTHDIADIVGDSRSTNGGGIDDNDDCGNGDNSYYCHRVVSRFPLNHRTGSPCLDAKPELVTPVASTPTARN